MADISHGTGLKPRWLHRLKAGDFEDPGVNKIEILHRYLSECCDRDRPTADAPMGAGMTSVATPTTAEPAAVDGKAA